MPDLRPYATAEFVTAADRPGSPSRATAGLEAGFALPVRDALALYAGLGLRAHQALLAPETGLLGTGLLQAQAGNLPGGAWGSLGYAYRDDFSGLGTHDLMATVERAVSRDGATLLVNGGYEWAGSRYRGPFTGVGLRAPFAPLGMTFLADGAVMLQDGGAAGSRTVATAYLGARRVLPGGLTLWARGGPEWHGPAAGRPGEVTAGLAG
ncbi:MAG: hypothetical protein FJZ01_14410, partial [Candidatus Sericytochromatia bacterium]|nr:hypothetical protein [Candidatus Tanganyikabacteria bacterium]